MLKEDRGVDLLHYYFEPEGDDTIYSKRIRRQERKEREIIFLVWHQGQWAYLHSLWEEASREEGTHVTVVVVPYYYKDAMGKVIEDEPVIETDGFPEEVEITPFDSYDFSDRLPDVCFFTCPYDEFHCGMTVEPTYYVRRIREYVDKLILIPPFVLNERVEEDDRSRIALRDFIETPGVVYADHIIVQSENLRQVWLEIVKSIPETGMIDWGRKICACGAPVWDIESAKREDSDVFPEKWNINKPDISHKNIKILLFQPGGSMLYEHGVDEIEREKRLLSDVSKCYQDELRVIWIPDIYAEDILKKHAPRVWKRYQRWMGEFESEGTGIVDSGTDFETAARLCDGFYGDAGVLMNRCRVEKKPVLWETPGTKKGEGEEGNEIIWDSGEPIAVEGDMDLSQFIKAVLAYEPTYPEGGCAERIWEVISGDRGVNELTVPSMMKRVALVYREDSDRELAGSIREAIGGSGRYELIDCPLNDKFSIQNYYSSWRDVPQLVLTINLAGFDWRSTGDNSFYATLSVNTMHYIDRDVGGTDELLSGLIPITMKFVTDDRARMKSLKEVCHRIYDICCVDSVTEEIVTLIDETDWRL